MRTWQIGLIVVCGILMVVILSMINAATTTVANEHATTQPAPTTDHPSTQPASQEPPVVKVKVFNAKGELVGPVESPVVTQTDEQWQQQLSPEAYRVARQHGTERAFTGSLLKNDKPGVYTCVACKLPLFDAATKFDSGTGWPSYYAPIASENITDRRDTSLGMVRTETVCARCESHLGHVFNDGPKPTGLRYCMNSAALSFTPADQLDTLADPAAESQTKTAVFAGGCFWCTEAVFEQLDGVQDVVSGYAGGDDATANYQAVSTGRTDHAEVIQITYDPQRVTYDKLLKVFFTVAHDPTQLNRQGNDVGRQYRSAIFYATEQEKAAAEAYIRKLNDEDYFGKPVVTTLEPLTRFHRAEAYHQDYAVRNPDQPYIRFQALPKVDKLLQKYPDAVRTESAPE